MSKAIDQSVENALKSGLREAPKVVKEPPKTNADNIAVELQGSAEPVLPVGRARSLPNKKQQEFFLDLCERKDAIETAYNKEMKKIVDQLRKLTTARGVFLREKPYTKDINYYVKPYCGFFMQKGAGLRVKEEVILDWAKINMRKMVQIDESESLDFVELRRALANNELPQEAGLALGILMKAISERDDIYQKDTNESLDSEQYEIARAKGLIPIDVVKKAEFIDEGIPAFAVRKLVTKYPRCHRCGEKKPKRRNKNEYTCIRCGYGETK